MKIAIAQMEITQGDVSANIARIGRFIKKAKSKRADVIVFPEYCLTGSVRDRPDLIDSKGAYRKIFSKLARTNKIDIVSGSFIERAGGKPYNTSCYFERGGKLLGMYRKINLWHSERGRISRGTRTAVFGTRFGKAGIAICWDLSDPLIFRKMAKAGARIIYVPSFWSTEGVSNVVIERRNIDSLCYARALETEAAIIYANPAGEYVPGDPLAGNSQMTLPIKGPVRKLAHNKERLIVADLPEKTLGRAAKVYKIGDDIRNGYLQ